MLFRQTAAGDTFFADLSAALAVSPIANRMPSVTDKVNRMLINALFFILRHLLKSLMVKILFTFIITVYHLKCKADGIMSPKYTIFLIHMRIPHIILISNALSALLSHVKPPPHITGTL